MLAFSWFEEELLTYSGVTRTDRLSHSRLYHVSSHRFVVKGLAMAIPKWPQNIQQGQEWNEAETSLDEEPENQSRSRHLQAFGRYDPKLKFFLSD